METKSIQKSYDEILIVRKSLFHEHLLKQIHGNDAHRYNIPEIGETIFIVDDFDGEMWKLKVKSLKTWDNGNSLEILCKGYRI